MALTPQEVHELKSQLIQQIEHLPEQQKAQAMQQIDSLSPQALESLVKQQRDSQKSVFRMIIEKEIDSFPILENPDALAVLEINPISQGHTIIVPKKPLKENDKVPQEIQDFTKKASEKLSNYLKPKSLEVLEEVKFGEKIINIIPVYDSPISLSSPRKKADTAELKSLAIKISNFVSLDIKKEVIKIEKPEGQEAVKIKRRIP